MEFNLPASLDGLIMPLDKWLFTISLAWIALLVAALALLIWVVAVLH
jgi:hypothetical protein